MAIRKIARGVRQGFRGLNFVLISCAGSYFTSLVIVLTALFGTSPQKSLFFAIPLGVLFVFGLSYWAGRDDAPEDYHSDEVDAEAFANLREELGLNDDPNSELWEQGARQRSTDR